ncbi:MAG TPA: ATP-binding cassette domain-containing protein [Thermoguttaceae bacterium]|nr:ATP-binding cassette domain-containing protein [Thermoguttaceae bacterium]
MTTLSLQHVAKIYPGNVRAVDDLSLDVAAGELLVLFGPSGCGKTTTLRLIAGLEEVTRGTISLAGRTVNRVRSKDRDVAMVFQNRALFPHLTVAENLAFGLRMRRTEKAEIERRVAETAEVLGIGPLLARRPGELSGGEQQRVALGRAIVRKPKLFLFDEPLANLDAPLRDQLRREIRRIHARLGITTVYVTHDQTEAMTLGRRIAVIREGRLQQLADPMTLYDRPANRFVAALIGSPAMNFFDGRIERRQGRLVFLTSQAIESDEGNSTHRLALPVPAVWTARVEPYVNRPITIGIRPEHIGCAAAEQAADAPRIPAVVEAVEPIGAESYVHWSTGVRTFVSRAATDRTVQPGDAARPAIATDHLHFFDPQTQRTVG